MATDGKPTDNRRSSAPAWIIVADKSKELGEGYVDVFYFFLYVSCPAPQDYTFTSSQVKTVQAYNLGNKVVGFK
jgi:hypothetical protein